MKSTLATSSTPGDRLPIPARKIAREKLNAPIMKNIVMTGAALTAVTFDPEFEFLGGLIRERFLSKGEKVVDKNMEAACGWARACPAG